MTWIYILISAFLLQWFFPWWSAAIPALAFGALLTRSGGHAFLHGSAGVGLLWLGAAAFIHLANQGILAPRIAEMMSLPNAFSLILVTGITGAMIGGFTAVSGFLIRQAVMEDKQEPETSTTNEPV